MAIDGSGYFKAIMFKNFGEAEELHALIIGYEATHYIIVRVFWAHALL